MNKIKFLLLSLFFMATAQAQDSTTAKAHAAYWCDCLTHVDTKLPKDSIIEQVETCQSLSLTNLLNKRIITTDILVDSARQATLNKITIALMLRDCSVLSSLLAATDEQEPVYREENPENIFIPVAFYKTYGLVQGETNTRLHVYNMKNKDDKYQRSVDIRWVFESKEDALKWHAMNLEQNSEQGEPVKSSFTISGAEQVSVFREAPRAAEMMKAFGMVQRHHYFIFVAGNVVCKVFVATDGTVDTKEVLPFAQAAARQVKENQPK